MAVECRNCGEPVHAQRVALGYDYCLKQACQARCLQRVRMAAVGVNKAADYFAKAEELLPPPGPAVTATPDDAPASASVRPGAPRKARAKSTLDRLREREAELDAALDGAYQRFCRAEITGAELDRQRAQLIKTFNALVLAENIRYRGRLRKQ
ncbi:MAG: hypothetical protein ACRD12_00660 [Acidimicrobiales bacterium]